ncbi:hypothetical protein [Paenibacillus sacheonensis]|uniref:Uncharacterized protein n=1 Tax=Paenibacillus sacheonensis TaxID=742054 RepID=A0A7X4YVA0_9BACL|nr:hypothetical protein [Paenibacillus sacheonensis]MBM7565681.1 hypothetical protein [Paenibacillus sacheonensis]NBC72261.1 hypothetical protein [Paenibacillus sacheonensis]
MRLEDALFNWLQIQLVAEQRPDDRAAADTRDFFLEILTDDHGVTDVLVHKTDDTMIHVKYVKDDRAKLQLYPREAAEQLLTDINQNPKYN